MLERLSMGKHWAYAIVVYVSLIAIELRGITSNCNRRTVGQFGDAFGTMWANWVQTKQSLPPWHESTDFVSFPSGEAFWTFDWWTSAIIRLPLQLFSRILGPICGYNTMVALGFLFSSLSMFLLVYWLTKKSYISILAGVMFGFGPYMQSKMTGHINYMFIGVYPILIYLLMRLPKRSNLGLIISGLVIGSYTYIDGYFFIPAITSVVILLIIQSFTALRESFKIKSLRNIKVSFFLSYFYMQIPIVILFFSKLSSGSQVAAQRDWNELNVYSIKAWNLILPPPSNPYLGTYFKDFQTQNLGGSNFSETGLYPGLAFMLLATYALYFYLIKPMNASRRSVLTEYTNKNEAIAQTKWLLFFLAFGILLSMRPWVQIIGIEVPFPSGILFHILPFWRTISRWGIISTVAIIALGSVGIAQVLQRKSKIFTLIILFIFTLVTVLDLGIPKTLDPKVVNATQVIGPYHWLNRNTSESAVVLDVVPYSVDGFFLGMALTSKRKMANPLRFPIESTALELLYPGRHDFLCNINAAQVDFLIIHPSFYNSASFPSIPGLRKIQQFNPDPKDEYFPWNNSAIYAPSRSYGRAFLDNYDSNFSLVGDGQWGADWFLMKSHGVIKIRNINPSTSKQASIDLKVKSYPESVNIIQHGKVIFTGTITPNKPVRLDLKNKVLSEISVVRLHTAETGMEALPNLIVEVKEIC